MKRKLFFIIALACCLVLAVGILAACNDEPADEGDITLPGIPDDGVDDPVESSITGRYYANIPSSGEVVWLQLNTDSTWESSIGIGGSYVWDNDATLTLLTYELNIITASYNSATNVLSIEINGEEFQLNLQEDYSGGDVFAVHFMVDGKVVHTTTELAAGDTISAPTIDSQDGNYLDGWYTDEAFGNKYDFNSGRIASSLVLHGRWLTGEISNVNYLVWMNEAPTVDADKREIFVIFDYYTDAASHLISLTTLLNLDSGVSVKWFSDEECTEELPTDVLASEIGLEDGDNFYWIKTYFPDGTEARTYTLNIHKQHYVIVWMYDPKGEHYTSYQLWTPHFSYHLDDGYVYTIEEWADAMVTREDLSQYGAFDGYTVSGWDIDDEEYNSTGMMKRDIHVYPIYTPNEYTVTLDAGEGELFDSDTATVAYDSTFRLPTPRRMYYHFLGWFLEDGTQITNALGYGLDTWSILEDTQLYAKWEIDRYTVTLTADTEGAQVLGAGEYDVLTKVTLQAITPIGYVFDGWYVNDRLVSKWQEYIIKVPIGGVHYTAKWTPKDEMADFIYVATPTECAITGVKNTSAEELYIPEYVTGIYSTSFDECSKLTSISVAEDNPYYFSYDGILYEKSPLQIYYVPLNITGDVELVDGVTTIKDSSFSCRRTITSIVIPNSVINIGQYAFSGCSGLIALDIPGSVISIGDGAFGGCTSLMSVLIPNSVTDIGNYAFEECSSLPTITIPGSVTSLNDYTFSDCTGLTSVTIKDGVTSIGWGAFENCIGLVDVIIPDTVTSIRAGVFSGCSSLESVTIPFVGAEAGKTPADTYQYPFGYIFGRSPYAGGVAVQQHYYESTATSTTFTTFYVPSSLRSVTVTGGNILHGAFQNCSMLTSVNLSSGVTSIGDYAFDECSSLISIIIPSSVTGIGGEAFSGCKNLACVNYIGDIAGWCEILFSYGVTNPLYYAHNLYLNGELVTDIVIPDSVTSIGDYAFFGCSGLTSVTIPDSVKSIGSYAFLNCTGLTSVVIGNGVASIGDYAFYGCSNLTSAAIPDSMTSIGRSAFSDCKCTEIDNDIIYIDDWAIGCSLSNIETITIKEGTSGIGDYAFNDHANLKSVSIPNSVIYIGDYAFYNCTGLTSVTIPESIMNIGDSSFECCYKLIDVHNKSSLNITAGSSENGYVAYYAKNVHTEEDGSWFMDTADGLRFFYDGTDCYLVAYYGEEDTITLPSKIIAYDGTEITKYAIHDAAFYRCTRLLSVTIPDSVTSIGARAFEDCIGLTSVDIGDGVTSIGDSAFDECMSLTSAIIGDSVVSIGRSAFSGCAALTSVIIPGLMISIGDYAFLGCKSLVSIIIPDSVTDIGICAFQYCDGLTSVTIGNGATSISDYAFCDCTGLLSAVIGNSVTSIGDYAFYNCSGLTSVTIPDSVTSIGEHAFEGCTDLTSVTIPDSVTSIGSYAFYYCTGLTSVTIGNGATSISDYAFYDCTGLTSVIIGNSVTSIGDSAFCGCTGLTSVTIPDSVTSIGARAFLYCTGLTSMTLGNGVTNVGESAFLGCASLTSITIPENVASIGSSAFYGCTDLVEIKWNAVAANDFSRSSDVFYKAGTSSDGITVTFGDSVIHIPAYLFYDWTSADRPIIISITIGNNVVSIGDYAFYYCTGLTSITIPDSVTSIGEDAFSGCTNIIDASMPTSAINYIPKDKLQTVVFTSGERIELYSFYERIGLTSVTIPDSVTSIGVSAFWGCASLTSVTFEGTIAEWSAIEKGSYWNYNCPFTKVMCSDGTVQV